MQRVYSIFHTILEEYIHSVNPSPCHSETCFTRRIFKMLWQCVLALWLLCHYSSAIGVLKTGTIPLVVPGAGTHNYCEVCIAMVRGKIDGSDAVVCGDDSSIYTRTCQKNLESLVRADRALTYWIRQGCLEMAEGAPVIKVPCPAYAICSWVANLHEPDPQLTEFGVSSLCPRDLHHLPVIPHKYKDVFERRIDAPIQAHHPYVSTATPIDLPDLVQEANDDIQDIVNEKWDLDPKTIELEELQRDISLSQSVDSSSGSLPIATAVPVTL